MALTIDELIERVAHAHDAASNKYNIALDISTFFDDYSFDGCTLGTDNALYFLNKQVKCIRILNLTDDDRLAYGAKLNLYPKGLHEFPVTIRAWNSSFALAITEATLRAIKELKSLTDDNR